MAGTTKFSYALRGFFVIAAVLLCCGLAFAQATAPSTPAQAPKPAEQPAAAEQLTPYQKSQLERAFDDWANLAKYRDADKALPAPAPDEVRVVFMGDSITEGWGMKATATSPGRGEFFPGKPYINRGISGQTTPQMLVRFRQDVIDLHPKVVIILAGTNDIAGNTGPMRLEDIEANYASMAELARAHDIKVIYSSMLPVHNYTPRSQDLFAQRSPEKILELNRWLKSYCSTSSNDKSNACLYLDYFSAMVDDKGYLRKELADDGLHPNPAGYKIMAPLAQSAIEKVLGPPKP